MPRDIVFVLYPGFVALDLTGPLDAFNGPNLLCGSNQEAPYRFTFVAIKPGPVTTASGLSVLADTCPERCRPHTLVVPGGVALGAEYNDPELLEAIKTLAAQSTRVASVCTGSLLLAACGLLDGRRATTHWLCTAGMARRYPAVHVEPDAIFVRDGHIHTSAGVTSGIDLALSLVEEDLGPETAMSVARGLVMYRRRVGNQSQFSAPLQAQAQAGARFAGLHAWMETRLGEDLGVDRLAGQAGMSPRNFARVFLAATGISPGRYVERLRLDRAREIIESGESHLQTVATLVGFRSEEQMRRAFQRRLGMTPSHYADHFSHTALPLQPCPS